MMRNSSNQKINETDISGTSIKQIKGETWNRENNLHEIKKPDTEVTYNKNIKLAENFYRHLYICSKAWRKGITRGKQR